MKYLPSSLTATRGFEHYMQTGSVSQAAAAAIGHLAAKGVLHELAERPYERAQGLGALEIGLVWVLGEELLLDRLELAQDVLHLIEPFGAADCTPGLRVKWTRCKLTLWPPGHA